MRIGPWIPPVAWMGVIFWLSTGTFSAEHTLGWTFPILRALFPWATQSQLAFLHWLGRKTAHVTEYAILAWLWHRALSKPAPRDLAPGARAWAALGLTVAYAILDELHQGWTGERGASPADVALDAVGGGVALTLRVWGLDRGVERLTAALLWFAAVGGSLLLLLNLVAGAAAAWLWASVPLAWLALWRWRHRRCVDGAGDRQ